MSTAKNEVPAHILELQKLFGDGTKNDCTNVFLEKIGAGEDMKEHVAIALKKHLKVGAFNGFSESHIQIFLDNVKMVSETKVANDKDVVILRKQLYEPDDFMTNLLMDSLFDNRDDCEEAKTAFDNVFLRKDSTTLVQLYHTDDQDIFQGVIVAAKVKEIDDHALCLVFVVD